VRDRLLRMRRVAPWIDARSRRAFLDEATARIRFRCAGCCVSRRRLFAQSLRARHRLFARPVLPAIENLFSRSRLFARSITLRTTLTRVRWLATHAIELWTAGRCAFRRTTHPIGIRSSTRDRLTTHAIALGIACARMLRLAAHRIALRTARTRNCGLAAHSVALRTPRTGALWLSAHSIVL
jgi:hypothetical protein